MSMGSSSGNCTSRPCRRSDAKAGKAANCTTSVSDLMRLAHTVALAEELSFARAARRAHLSSPAFSRSIQALEDSSG